MRTWLGRDGFRLGVGTVAVVALAAACDSGSTSSFDDVAGAAGTNTAGANAAGANGAGKNTGGSADSTAGSNAAGSSNPQGGMGGMGGMGGSSPGGGTDPNGGVATAGTTSGSGGSAGGIGMAGEAGMSSAGAAGTPSGDGGMGGDTSTPGGAGEAGQGGSGEVGCGGKALSWKPSPSKVMLLLDRSGTMFDVDGKPWTTVRDSLLPVVDAYDGQRNIGFMAMTGELATCPLLDEVAPVPNNYAAISAKYTPLTKPTKGESPFMLALSRARELLDVAAGAEPFVIMIIDGQPDYCNDGDPLCPIDSVVARIQLLKSAGITTLVAGLPLTANAVGDAAVYAAALQSYANAGVGLPVASVGNTEANLYFQCSGGNPTAPSWPAEFAASGKPAQKALGTYSASPGAAAFTSLDPTSGAGMTTAFSQLLARTNSCIFQTTAGSVVQAAAATGVVKLDNVAVNYDATNGWHLKSATEVELVGTACSALRASATAQVSIEFPCAAVGN